MATCLLQQTDILLDRIETNPETITPSDMMHYLNVDSAFINRLYEVSKKRKAKVLHHGLLNKTNIRKIYSGAIHADKEYLKRRSFFKFYVQDDVSAMADNNPILLSELIDGWFKHYVLSDGKGDIAFTDASLYSKVASLLIDIDDMSYRGESIGEKVEQLEKTLSDISASIVFKRQYKKGGFSLGDYREMGYLTGRNIGHLLTLQHSFSNVISKEYRNRSKAFDKYIADNLYNGLLELDEFMADGGSVGEERLIVPFEWDELSDEIKENISAKIENISNVNAFVYGGKIYIRKTLVSDVLTDDSAFYGKGGVNDILIEEGMHLITLYMLLKMKGDVSFLQRLYEQISKEHPDLDREARVRYYHLMSDDMSEFYHEAIAYIVVNSRGVTNVGLLRNIYRKAKRILYRMLLALFGGLRGFAPAFYSSAFASIEGRLRYEQMLDEHIERIESFIGSKNRLSDIINYIRKHKISNELFAHGERTILFNAAIRGTNNAATKEFNLVNTLANIYDALNNVNVAVSKPITNSQSKTIISQFQEINKFFSDNVGKGLLTMDRDAVPLTGLMRLENALNGVFYVQYVIGKTDLVTAMLSDLYGLEDAVLAEMKYDMETMKWADFLNKWFDDKQTGVFKSFNTMSEELGNTFVFLDISSLVNDLKFEDNFKSTFETYYNAYKHSHRVDVFSLVMSNIVKIDLQTFESLLMTIQTIENAINKFGETSVLKMEIDKIANSPAVSPQLKEQLMMIGQHVELAFNTLKLNIRHLYAHINSSVINNINRMFSERYAVGLFLSAWDRIAEERIVNPLRFDFEDKNGDYVISNMFIRDFNETRAGINTSLERLTQDKSSFFGFLNNGKVTGNDKESKGPNDDYAFCFNIYMNVLYKLDKNIPLKPAESIMVMLINGLINHLNAENIQKEQIPDIKSYIVAVVYSLLPFMSLDPKSYLFITTKNKNIKDITTLQQMYDYEVMYNGISLSALYFVIQNIYRHDDNEQQANTIKSFLNIAIERSVPLKKAVEHYTKRKNQVSESEIYDVFVEEVNDKGMFGILSVITGTGSLLSKPAGRSYKIKHQSKEMPFNTLFMFFSFMYEDILFDIKSQPDISSIISASRKVPTFNYVVGVHAFYASMKEDKSYAGVTLVLNEKMKIFSPLIHLDPYSMVATMEHDMAINKSEQVMMFGDRIIEDMPSEIRSGILASAPVYNVIVNEDKIDLALNQIMLYFKDTPPTNRVSIYIDIVKLANDINKKNIQDVNVLFDETLDGLKKVFEKHSIPWRKIFFTKGGSSSVLKHLFTGNVLEKEIIKLFFKFNSNLSDRDPIVKKVKESTGFYPYQMQSLLKNANLLLKYVHYPIALYLNTRASIVIDEAGNIETITKGKEIDIDINDTAPFEEYEFKGIDNKIDKQSIVGGIDGLIYVLEEAFDKDLSDVREAIHKSPYLTIHGLYYLGLIGLNYRMGMLSDNKEEHKHIYERSRALFEKMLDYITNGDYKLSNELSLYIRQAAYQKEYKNNLRRLDIPTHTDNLLNEIRGLTEKDTNLFFLISRIEREHGNNKEHATMLKEAITLFSDINSMTVNESTDHEKVIVTLHKVYKNAMSDKDRRKRFKKMMHSLYKMTKNALVRIEDNGSIVYLKDKNRQVFENIDDAIVEQLGLWIIDDSGVSFGFKYMAHFMLEGLQKPTTIQQFIEETLKELYGVYVELKNNQNIDKYLWRQEYDSIFRRIDEFYDMLFDISNGSIVGMKKQKMSAFRYGLSIYDISIDLKHLLTLLDSPYIKGHDTKEIREISKILKFLLSGFNRALYVPFIEYASAEVSLLKNLSGIPIYDRSIQFFKKNGHQPPSAILSFYRKNSNNARNALYNIQQESIYSSYVLHNFLLLFAGVPLSNSNDRIKHYNALKDSLIIDKHAGILLQEHRAGKDVLGNDEKTLVFEYLDDLLNRITQGGYSNVIIDNDVKNTLYIILKDTALIDSIVAGIVLYAKTISKESITTNAEKDALIESIANTVMTIAYNQNRFRMPYIKTWNDYEKHLKFVKALLEQDVDVFVSFANRLLKKRTTTVGQTKVESRLLDYYGIVVHPEFNNFFSVVRYHHGRNTATYDQTIVETAELNAFDYKANKQDANTTYSYATASDIFNILKLYNYNQGWAGVFKRQNTKERYKTDSIQGVNSFKSALKNRSIELTTEEKKKHIFHWRHIRNDAYKRAVYEPIIRASFIQNGLAGKTIHTISSYMLRLAQEYKDHAILNKKDKVDVKDRNAIALFLSQIMKEEISKNIDHRTDNKYIKSLLLFANNLMVDMLASTNGVRNWDYVNGLFKVIREELQQVFEIIDSENVDEKTKETAKILINKAIYGIETPLLIMPYQSKQDYYKYHSVLLENVVYSIYLWNKMLLETIGRLKNDLDIYEQVDAFFYLVDVFEGKLNLFDISEDEHMSLSYKFLHDISQLVEKNMVVLLTEKGYNNLPFVMPDGKKIDLYEALEYYDGFIGDLNYYLILDGFDRSYAHYMQIKVDVNQFANNHVTFESYKLGRDNRFKNDNFIVEILYYFMSDDNNRSQDDISDIDINSFNNRTNYDTGISSLARSNGDGLKSVINLSVYLKNISQVFTSMIVSFFSYRLQSGFINYVMKQLLGKNFYISNNKGYVVVDRLLNTIIGLFTLYVLYMAYSSFSFLAANMVAALLFSFTTFSKSLINLAYNMASFLFGNVRSTIGIMTTFINNTLSALLFVMNWFSYFTVSLITGYVSSILAGAFTAFNFADAFIRLLFGVSTISTDKYNNLLNRAEDLIQMVNNLSVINAFTFRDVISKQDIATHKLVRYLLGANNVQIGSTIVDKIRNKVVTDNRVSNMIQNLMTMLLYPMNVVFLFKTVFENNLNLYQLLYELSLDDYIVGGMAKYFTIENGIIKPKEKTIKRQIEKINDKISKGIELTEQEERFMNYFKDISGLDKTAIVSRLVDYYASLLPEKVLATINSTKANPIELGVLGKTVTMLRTFGLHFLWHHLLSPAYKMLSNTIYGFQAIVRGNIGSPMKYFNNVVKAGLVGGSLLVIGYYTSMLLKKWAFESSAYGALIDSAPELESKLQEIRCLISMLYKEKDTDKRSKILMTIKDRSARLSLIVKNMASEKAINIERESDSATIYDVMFSELRDKYYRDNGNPNINNYIDNVFTFIGEFRDKISNTRTNIFREIERRGSSLAVTVDEKEGTLSLGAEAGIVDKDKEALSLKESTIDKYNKYIESIEKALKVNTYGKMLIYDMMILPDVLESLYSRMPYITETQENMIADRIATNFNRNFDLFLQNYDRSDVGAFYELRPFSNREEVLELMHGIKKMRAGINFLPADATLNYLSVPFEIINSQKNYSGVLANNFVNNIAFLTSEQVTPISGIYDFIFKDISDIQKEERGARVYLPNLVLLNMFSRTLKETDKEISGDESINAIYRANLYESISNMNDVQNDEKVDKTLLWYNRMYTPNVFYDYISIDHLLAKAKYIPQLNKYKINTEGDLDRACDGKVGEKVSID